MELTNEKCCRALQWKLLLSFVTRLAVTLLFEHVVYTVLNYRQFFPIPLIIT